MDILNERNKVFMKISIITVLNTINYGSVLQTFATQKYLESLGMEVEFVDYIREDQQFTYMIKKIVFDKKTNIKKWLKKPIRDIMDIISVFQANKLFRSFLTQNIHLTAKQYTSLQELKKDVPCADIYATGSDQMWNSGWNQGIEKSFFLEYVPNDKKRIAFSTSIGKVSWDQKEADIIVPLIKKYDYITLREKSAVELLGRYGIESHLVLDPTLLFNRSQWIDYLPPKQIHTRYLLVYQLHLKHDQADFMDAVNTVATRKGLQIKRISYSYSDHNIGKKIVLPDVFTFLRLIYDAEFIITDSFHGMAFSINFNKQFAVVYPDQYSTRMDSLLSLLGLKNRRYICNNSEIIEKRIDYTYVNQILDSKRKEIEYSFKKYFHSLDKI